MLMLVRVGAVMPRLKLEANMKGRMYRLYPSLHGSQLLSSFISSTRHFCSSCDPTRSVGRTV